MSLDASTLHFLEQIRGASKLPTWIEERLLNELPHIATGMPWPTGPTGCLLSDIGNYLIRILHVLTSFAENLLEEKLISGYIDARIQELAAEDDLSTANYIDDKHTALQEILSKLSQTMKGCERDWSFTLCDRALSVPFQGGRGSGGPFPQHQVPIVSLTNHIPGPSLPRNGASYSMPAQQPSPRDLGAFETDSFASCSGREASENLVLGDGHLYHSSSASVGASDSGPSPSNTADPLSKIPLLDELKSRGKGHFTCPRRYDCKNGGVQPNGDLTVFERNSAFRAHLQLHERSFKCDLPGCTNRKGFARVDQLERHKASVKHYSPGWVDDAPP